MTPTDRPCHNCGRAFHQIGCTHSGRPFHWCPACGSIRSCDGDEATPGHTPRAVQVGILLAAGLHSAFEGTLGRAVRVEEAAHWVTHTPIEKSSEARGQRLWENLIGRTEIPPYHPEQEEPL